jgi:hypothetical protein
VDVARDVGGRNGSQISNQACKALFVLFSDSPLAKVADVAASAHQSRPSVIHFHYRIVQANRKENDASFFSFTF